MLVIQSDARGARLERALRERIRGEVRFDAKSRLLYSTDASLYQILPVGVVIPRDADDVASATRLAAERRVEMAGTANGRVFLHRLEGGHWINTDNPEGVIALLRDHLP